MMFFDNAAVRRDWWFLGACAALFFCGVITMYSLGLAKEQPWAYKQLIFGVVALVLFVAAGEVPLQIWRRRALLLVIAAVVLLLVVWLFGAERKGAQRWLVFGGLSLQPVEFFKFAALLIGANFCARAAHTKLGWDLAQPLLFALLIPLVFLLHQPDVGSFLLIIMVSILMLFLAGLKIRWFVGGLFLLLALFGALVAAKPYILQRLVSFGNPLDDRYGSDYNVALSLMAFDRGGVVGAGGGNLLAGQNLPEAHNDFIIAVIAEERGLFGFVVVAVLLLFVIMRAAAIGVRAAKRDEMFGAFYAFGFAALAAMQVVINISGSLALLPVKGLTLPLVSYGGSSLTAMALMIAVLMRVDRETRESEQ